MEKQIHPQTIALRFNNCINQRDLQGLSDLMTDDHRMIDSLNQRTEGKEANKENWKRFFELFPDYQNIFDTVTHKANMVIMQGYCTCTDERLNNLQSIWTAEVKGNQLKEWRIWADTPENREILGIGKPI